MKNKIITLIFIAYIIVFAAGSIISKDRVFSDMENRNLAMLPDANKDDILSGKYSDEFESYMSDQIIFKDFLVKLKVSTNRAMGQTHIGDVYFGANNMLIKEYNDPYVQLEKNVNYINDFVENCPEFEYTWLIAPNAAYIYSENMPSYAENASQGKALCFIKEKTSDKIKLADCSEALGNVKDQYIYYNTDHHWTGIGAYIGYVELCKALLVEPTPKEQYVVTAVNDEFYGTLYSNAPTFTQKSDSIILFDNEAGEYKVTYYDTNVTADSLYNYDNLNIKDKYKFYLDGNHSYVKIESNSSNNEKILVVKDSYAHSLLPLLADNYSEIHVVDLRYYHDSVSELAKENDIKKIVFINNLDFLSTDNNFLWLQ